jgi:hypothetical protein
MKMKVTDQGLTIPKQMLDGAEEVEVRHEDGHLVVIPLLEEDPLFGFGSNPVKCGLTDGSVNHDRYLYDPAK